MSALPHFTLADADGRQASFPTGRPALLSFVKEDCPTCDLSMPLIEAAHTAFGDACDVLCIGQEAAGNAILSERHSLNVPIFDDSTLAVSFAYDLDTVPTVILTDGEGNEQRRFIGFGRDDWKRLYRDLIDITRAPAPVVDWSAYPESRPGCGSRSVEPGIADRLAAEAAGSPIRARRIDVGERDDLFEFMFDQGLTDGLPVVPPTPERVMRMLSGTKRDPQEELGLVPPNLAPLTVEKVAINAVMAGCKPEYLPVVLAAIEAVLTEEFNMHGVLATTHYPTPVIIVNGPIRHRIGMNMGMNVLGQGNRANATIGRAVQLVVRNVGGGRPGEVDRAAHGHPGKFTFCFPEWEERSHWEPLHVERGFRADQSTVTVFAGGAPNGMIDQLARGPRQLANSYGLALSAVGHPKNYRYGEIGVVVTPEHADTFAKEGWTKDQVREQIQAASSRPARELQQNDDVAEGMPAAMVEQLGPDTLVPKFRDPKGIMLMVAGGEAGKWGTFLQGWVTGPMGSITMTKPIGD